MADKKARKHLIRVNPDDMIDGSVAESVLSGMAQRNAPVAMPEEPSMLRSLGDSGIAAGTGLVTGVKLITDAFGADNPVSRGLGDVGQGMQGLLSPYRKAELQNRARLIREAEQSGSTAQEIGAYLGGLAEAPLDTLLNVAGTAAPTVASMLIPGAREANIARALGVTTGAIQGAGAGKSSIYDAVLQQKLQEGVPEAEARAIADAAQSYGGENADTILANAALGAVAGGSGLESAAHALRFGKAAQAAPGLLRRTATGAVVEGLPEAGQGGMEQASANIAMQREGYDVPTMRGVAGSAALEGVAGGALGGVMAIPTPAEPAAVPQAGPVIPVTGPLTKAVNAGNGPMANAVSQANANALANLDQLAQEEAGAEPPPAAPADPLKAYRATPQPSPEQKAAADQALAAEADQNELAGVVPEVSRPATAAAPQAPAAPAEPAGPAFANLDEADAYVDAQVKRNGSAMGVPVQNEDGSIALVPKGDARYTQAIRDRMARKKARKEAANANAGRSEPVGPDAGVGPADADAGVGNPAVAADPGDSGAPGVSAGNAAVGDGPGQRNDALTPSMVAATNRQPTGLGPQPIAGQPAGTRGTTAADVIKPAPKAEQAAQPVEQAAPAPAPAQTPDADENSAAAVWTRTPTAERLGILARPGWKSAADGKPGAGAQTTANRAWDKLSDTQKARITAALSGQPANAQAAEGTGTQAPKAPADQAPAATGGDATRAEQQPVDAGAGSAPVEADGLTPKEKWLKAILDANRLMGPTGPQIGVKDGKLNYNGNPFTSKAGKALVATVEEARKAGASDADIIAALNERQPGQVNQQDRLRVARELGQKAAKEGQPRNPPTAFTSLEKQVWRAGWDEAQATQGATPQVPVEPAKREAFEHAGLKVYPTRVNIGGEPVDRWAVQLPENKGTSKVGGDTLHETVEAAKKDAELLARQAADRAETRAKIDAQEKVEAEAKAAKQEANKGKSLLERRAEAVLDKQVKDGETGEVTTRRAWVAKKVAEGLKPKVEQEDKIKPMSRAQFNRASNEEQRAHERKVKEAGKKDTYWLGDYSVTKIEYDYAKSLDAGGAADPAPAKPAKETKAQREAREAEERRATYFTPGNIVQGYSGHDRVIAYTPPSKPGGAWSVQVQHVVKRDGEWIVDPQDPRERSHATEPSAADYKRGPVAQWKGAAPAKPKDDMLPNGWAQSENGFTKRAVFRKNQDIGQPFAVVNHVEGMTYDIEVRHGDKAVDSARVVGARSEALAKADALLAKANETASTHQDPGEKPEAVTPGVVKESLTKAAKNEDRKPSEMKADLLRMIDEALAKAPEEAENSITFDVPGDGTFKVQNSREGLSAFRKKVEASPGFKDKGTPAQVSDRTKNDEAFGVERGSSGTQAAILNMLNEGDYQAAKDYADFKGLSEAEWLAIGKKLPKKDQSAFDAWNAGKSAPASDEKPNWKVTTNDAGRKFAVLEKEVGSSRLKVTASQGVGETAGFSAEKNGEPRSVLQERFKTLREAMDAAEQWIESQGDEATKPWHTPLPTEGSKVTNQDRTTPSNPKSVIDGRKVVSRLAQEAMDAITRNQNENIATGGIKLTPWVLPATNDRNGVVRLLPEDQTPGAPWQQIGTEPLPLGGPRERALGQLMERLRSAPIIASDDAGGVDLKGFSRVDRDGGAFDLRSGNMTVRVEPMGDGKFQASFRGAKSSPHLQGVQGAVDWAATYRDDASKSEPKIPDGYKPAGEPFYRDGKLTQGYAPFAIGERVTMKDSAGQSGEIEGFARADERGVFDAAMVRFDNGSGQLVPLRQLTAESRQKTGNSAPPEYPLAPAGSRYEESDKPIKMMSPDQFLAAVRPLEIDEASRDNIDDLKRHIQSGKTLDPLHIRADGKEDGRHRAVAAKELGIKQVPVIDERTGAKAGNAGRSYRDPAQVSFFKPYEDGDWVKVGGEDWQVKNADGGWELRKDGDNWRTAHPTVRGLRGMNDFIAAVNALVDEAGADKAPAKIKDEARAQELRNSIDEGKMILSSGRDAAGKKLSAAKLEGVRRSIQSAKEKLDALERVADGSNDKPAPFSRTGSSVALPVNRQVSEATAGDEVEQRIGGFAHQPPVRIRDSADGVLPNVTVDDGVAGAVYQGAIYLFRDQLGSRSDVQRTLFHELLHYGLRRFLTREQYVTRLLELAERDAYVMGRARKWAASEEGQRAKAFGGDDYALARGVDEALAELAEPNGGAYLRNSFARRALRTVQRWIADMAEALGFGKVATYWRGLSNEEARQFIQSIFGQLQSDASPSSQDWAFTADPAFAKESPSLEKKHNLLIQHNLTVGNLMHAAKMGGIPVPSLAVTKADAPLVNFGEITLIGPKEMADPKGYAGTKVFGADIYSPRYPRFTFQFTPNMRKRAEGTLREAMEATDSKYIEWSEVEKEGARELERNAAFLWKFLTDKGLEPRVTRTEVKPLPAALAPFADGKLDAFDLMRDKDFIEAAWNMRRADLLVFNEGNEAETDAELKAEQARVQERGQFFYANSLARQIESYRRDLRDNGKVDGEATRRALRNQVKEADLDGELEAAASQFIQDLAPNERIFQGFTPSGNRKYVPHTLENVVKILKKELRGGEGFNYGTGSLRAKFTPQFKSLEAIRKAKDRLVTSEQFEVIKKEIDSELMEISNDFGHSSLDTTLSMIEDAASQGVDRAAKEYNRDAEVTPEQRATVYAFMEKLRNLPTAYFEAKVLRDVDVAEFKVAVAPSSLPEKARAYLEGRGVKVVSYESGSDADRAQKIKAAAEQHGTLFSRNRAGNGVPMRDAQAAVALIRRELPNAPDIVILADNNDAPAGLQNDIRNAGAEFDWEAAYYDGKIYVKPDHIADLDRFMFVVGRHEIRHAGFDAMLGDQKDAVLLSIGRANRRVMLEARQKMADGLAKSFTVAVEEALADMPVEDIAALSRIKILVSAIRRWLRATAQKLRKAGLTALANAIEPKTWTDNDVIAFVAKSESMSRGGGGIGAQFSRQPGFFFDAKESPLYKERDGKGVVSGEKAQAALATDAVARRIMAKGIEVQDGDLVGVRLNINVLKNTGVPVNTIHRGGKTDGYTKNRGLWGGEVIAYEPVVTVREAYLNVGQKAREAIASGADSKSPMASVDGRYVKTDKHSFDGVEFRFNPAREHLFRDGLGRVLKYADEVTVTGHSVYARGRIEYYGAEDVPARAGDAPTQGRLFEPGNDTGTALFSRAKVVTNDEGHPEFQHGDTKLAFPIRTQRIEVIEGPGQSVMSYAIMPADGFDVLGHVELLLENGRPVSLLDIVAYDRGNGVGRKAVETVLRAYPDADLNISNIVPEAQGFWERMGIPTQNLEEGAAYDGTLNLQTFLEAQDGEGPQGGPGRAGAQGGRAYPGAKGGAPGAVQGRQVGARFSRRNSLATLRDAGARRVEAVREANLFAGYKVGDFMASTGKLSWWDKTIGTPFNLAKRHPDTFGKVYDNVQAFLNDVSYYATEAANLAPTILPKMETLADLKKQAIDPKDNKAVAAPIFEGTLTWTRDKGGKAVPMEKAEADAAKMTAEEKAQELLRANALDPNVLRMWKGLPLDQYEAMVNTRYTNQLLRPGVVWSDTELRNQFGLSQKQIDLYREFRAAIDRSLDDLMASEVVRLTRKSLPDMAQKEGQSADDFAMEVRDALYELGADDLGDTVAQMANRVRDLKEKGYAPLSRFGQYTLDVVDADGERVYFGLFESQAEANKKARELRAEFPQAEITQGTQSQEAYKMLAGVSPETIELFGEILGLDATGDSASDEAFQEYLKRAKSTRSAMKRLIHRKGIAGFSEDTGRVLAGFITSNARRTASNRNLKAVMESVEAIPKSQGELKDYAAKVAEYVNNPVEEAQALRGLMFAQYLGGSLASAVVNMTQPIAVTMPFLSQFTTAAKAAKLVAGAMADMASRKKLEGSLEKALELAEEKGIVAPQEIHYLAAMARGQSALRSGDGTKAGNALAAAQNGLSRLTVAWGKLFGFAELVNRRATFIASYRLAVANGYPDPFKFAAEAVDETQFVYNKGNRPQWARGAVGATLFTFKTYSISYMELLARMWKLGGPDGKKAFALAIVTMLLMSGLDELPFMEDAEDVVDGFAQKVLGLNWQTKMKRHEFMANVLGKDLAEFLNKGVSGVPGVPLDVSGRLGMGNLIPGTGLLRGDSQSMGRDVAEIAGPVADLVKRAGSAIGMAAQGDLGKAALEVSPVAVRNVAKAADMADTGMYRDAQGRKVVDTTMGEALLKGVGFQPNSVAKIQDGSAMKQRMIALNKIVEGEIADQWAQGRFENDPAKVEKARNRLKEWNKDNPDSPIRIEQSQIMRRLKQMRLSKQERIDKTAPKELRAEVKRELSQ